MKIVFLQLFLWLLPLALAAQTEFFGHYESETDAANVSGRRYNYGYNKLRLDLLAYPSNTVTVGANLNIQRFNGQSRWNLFDFLPRHLWVPYYGDSAEFPIVLPDTLYLDNVFIKMRFARLDITAGKQQISLGTGYAWNPLDIFNQKQLLDPTYEQTGVTAIRAEVPLADRLLMDFIVATREDWESSPRLARIKLGLGSFDLTASAGIFHWSQAPNTERKLIGGAAVGELLGVGLWTEGAWNELDDGEDFAEYLIGLDHTFDFQTYLLVEYFHNGSGVADKGSLQISDYLNYMGGLTHSLMQDYVFVVVNHPLADVLSLGLLGFANLNDHSCAVAPQLEWSAFENVNISLLASRSMGAEDTEFGLQDWGLRLRLRAYF
ncbi:MAG: hypothetical protein JSU77_03655 [Fidelibacterota bacterium]|nr:MAG: hypothetical protein JSU77_03655 [Candidatus Neomarinimicrobiota bacterium]